MHTKMQSSEAVLVVRHLPGSNPASFQVERLRDGKASQPAVLPSPFGFPVEGRPDSDLMHELQWYLEKFLDYPFSPETDHAARVQKALCDWGEQAFQALFGNRASGRMFDAATAEDYSDLHLQISSDDPQVMSWPWEAMRDPELGVLAHTCQIERRLNAVRDPQELPQSLPKDRVNILLVVARPYGKKDVRFRSVARSLVELIEKEKLPAQVELLRPPTFENLREHLRKHPGFYHILHFDGHGGYLAADADSGDASQGPEGKLIFETEEAEPDLVTAEKLSVLLKECAVPGVVLNACQSAMVGGDSHDPFASVATALLRSGMRDVVAMAYSLYVSGAQQFLPAFYRRLFEAGNVSVAVRAGRQQMLEHNERTCVRGEFPLQDWLLPVVYQQDSLNFSFVADAQKQFVPPASKLPEELRRERNPYGFVGRDRAILEMERARRRPPAGILIQGLGGVGKTTLARGFLQWLDQTGGLDHGCFWFSFQEIRSAEFVFNRLGEALFDEKFPALAMEQKIQKLTDVLRDRQLVLVWDNFESATGIPGTAIAANLPDADRRLLAQFLDELRGGATKVIITSRSPEDWLGPQRRYALALGGLDGEERWEYCNAVLRDLGQTINRKDSDLVELMNLLGGHPLAMRAVLPRLEKMSAGQVLAALRSNLSGLKLGADDDEARLNATLSFVEQSLPQELRPLLTLLGMHEGSVDAGYMETMAKQVDAAWTRDKIDGLMDALVSAGLLRGTGQASFEMHPLLTSYLRTAVLPSVQPGDRDTWARAFVDVMAGVADGLIRLERDQQRVPFHLHGQNFHYALSEAERLEMSIPFEKLTQALAISAFNTRNFGAAARLYESLAARGRSRSQPKMEDTAYYQLGMIAEEQDDFVAAEQWFRKAVVIEEKLGDERSAAATYHQLGNIAEQNRDFVAAEQWYRKSLDITERLGIETQAALTYLQLGTIAQEQRDFATAEQWYRKSLDITERLGRGTDAALTYHNLGTAAELQGDLAAAEQWYRKALAVWEKSGDEHNAANTYHQLGMIAEEQRDFAAAEQWYRKSLAVTEKEGNEHAAAGTYHQLGMVAQKQHDFALAEQWYRKALKGWERSDDEHNAAKTYNQLGSVVAQHGDFASAEQWYRKALAVNEKSTDGHSAALTYGLLGSLSRQQGNYIASGGYYVNSILLFRRTGDLQLAAKTIINFMGIYKMASPDDQKKLEAMWTEAGLEAEMGDLHDWSGRVV